MKGHALGIEDLKTELRRQIKRGGRIHLLGFVEYAELSPEVYDYFLCFTHNGLEYYNWVAGNQKLHDLVKQLKTEMGAE